MKPEPNTIMQFDNESGKFIYPKPHDYAEDDPVIRSLREHDYMCWRGRVVRDASSDPGYGCLGILLAIFLASCIGAAYLFKLVFLN